MVPVIKERPKVIILRRQKKIIIKVIVATGAKPKVIWYKESAAVREDSRRQVKIDEISKGQYEVALEIDKVDRSDKGSYKLAARNEKGECTSQSVEVDVQGKLKLIIMYPITCNVTGFN